MLMVEQYGLSSEVIKKICAVFLDFPEIERVILYGSRAMGNYRNGSDIDLTLIKKEDDSLSLLTSIMTALDDLDLIYSFDVSFLSHINNPNLLDHIERVGIDFCCASGVSELKNQ